MTPAEHDKRQAESDAGMEQWHAERPERMRKMIGDILEGVPIAPAQEVACDIAAASFQLIALRAEVERLRAENAILRRIPDKVASDERERCASLCERLPYGSGLAGRTYAEAIRGVGLGARLAKGGTP
jgi:hypothetical protein